MGEGPVVSAVLGKAVDRIANPAALALLLAMLVAIVAQDFAGALPLGLFNDWHDRYVYVAFVALLCITGAIVVLALELVWKKATRLASVVRVAIVLAVLTELLLLGVDRGLLSRNPRSHLGGPYYELETSDGAWTFVRKAHTYSPLGFRTDREYELVPERPRILFLGDSYTEGSGNARECNYPNVVQATIEEQLGDVEVMNAGVAGYGPTDAQRLLTVLTDRGYEFDALVFNALLENDFTDNLPKTDRRVVGGMYTRFPSSRFLRVFHPLNSHTVRYGLVTWRLGTFVNDAQRASALRQGSCDLRARPQGEVGDWMRWFSAQRRAGTRRAAGSPAAQARVTAAIEAMHARADSADIPFVVVVFPDRVVADSAFRVTLGVAEEELAPHRTLQSAVERATSGLQRIDVADVLTGRKGMYRRGDSHLSDLGNVVAGRYVGESLVPALRGRLPERRGPRSAGAI